MTETGSTKNTSQWVLWYLPPESFKNWELPRITAGSASTVIVNHSLDPVEGTVPIPIAEAIAASLTNLGSATYVIDSRRYWQKFHSSQIKRTDQLEIMTKSWFRCLKPIYLLQYANTHIDILKIFMEYSLEWEFQSQIVFITSKGVKPKIELSHISAWMRKHAIDCQSLKTHAGCRAVLTPGVDGYVMQFQSWDPDFFSELYNELSLQCLARRIEFSISDKLRFNGM